MNDGWVIPSQSDASIHAHLAMEAIERHGFCVIEGALPSPSVSSLLDDLAGAFETTPCSEGSFYGATTRRFQGLLRRSHHMDQFVRHPIILDLAETILGDACDTIQLNLTQAIEIMPGGTAQPPHRDQDMWPVRVPGTEYLVNVMWPFTPYRPENGATMLWPGSHRQQDALYLDPEKAVQPAMNPGAALVFLGSTLHAGGANRTSVSRKGMIISYSLGWLKPYELPWLAYPPKIARKFPPALAALAGYKVHRPNLGTYEGRCPSYLLDPYAPQMGAVDALRPDQMALIEQYESGMMTTGFEAPDSLA